MDIHLVKKYFNPASILDIGGHTGEFFNLCINNFSLNYYFLIEGNDNCHEDIKKLNIPYYIGLVGSYNGEVNFFLTKDDIKSTGNSIYRENTKHFSDEKIIIEKKKIIKLNTLFEKFDKKFDLIKIDTQGSELDILRGGTNFYTCAKGIILEVSLIEYNKNAPLEKEVIDYMDSINFKPAEVLKDHYFSDGVLIQKDILFLNKDLF